MDFEKQIQTDRESLIQDIMKLVSIDSVETAPDAGMPFGAGAAKALDCFLETAESIGLKTENFDYPVCIDEKDSINKLNHFPVEMRFQTLLLDKENKVLAIGNPVQNPKIKELYLKIISGESAFMHITEPLTQVEVNKKSIK